MASDPKSKTLAVATGRGIMMFIQPVDEGEWAPVQDLNSKPMIMHDNPALSVDVVQRG